METLSYKDLLDKIQEQKQKIAVCKHEGCDQECITTAELVLQEFQNRLKEKGEQHKFIDERKKRLANEISALLKQYSIYYLYHKTNKLDLIPFHCWPQTLMEIEEDLKKITDFTHFLYSIKLDNSDEEDCD